MLSLDPGTSIRRFALTACVITVTAVVMLLPKSQSELARWLSIAALALLAICYLGVLLAPHLSIHLATDTQEPQLAGDWRGAFGHKNVAAAMMAMMLFVGIYVARAGARLSGIAIVALAAFFLFKAEGKSSTALFFAVLALTSLAAVVRAFWLRAVILLAPLLVLNMLSVGTVMSPTLAAIAEMLPIDTTFHRPHRHLDLRDPGAAEPAADRLRLLGVLGQQFDPEFAAGHGMGGVRLAQP